MPRVGTKAEVHIESDDERPRLVFELEQMSFLEDNGYKRKIPDIVKAEDTQTDCFTCQEAIIERLPFLGEKEGGPNKPADIGEYDIMKVQRKGKGRYLPFIIPIISWSNVR